eukprot:2594716-Rhodomonas_salina.1
MSLTHTPQCGLNPRTLTREPRTVQQGFWHDLCSVIASSGRQRADLARTPYSSLPQPRRWDFRRLSTRPLYFDTQSFLLLLSFPFFRYPALAVSAPASSLLPLSSLSPHLASAVLLNLGSPLPAPSQLGPPQPRLSSFSSVSARSSPTSALLFQLRLSFLSR